MNNSKTHANVIMITDDCINCGACETECPVNAVRQVPEFTFINNNTSLNRFFSAANFYIDPNKCNHCSGSFSSPRCNDVCPVACCVTEEEAENNLRAEPGQPSYHDQFTKFSEYDQFLKLNPLLFANISLN